MEGRAPLPRKLQIGEDSFIGVKPIFILNDEKTLTVIWGNTKSLAIPEELNPTSAREAQIVHQTEELISALETIPRHCGTFGRSGSRRRTHFKGISPTDHSV